VDRVSKAHRNGIPLGLPRPGASASRCGVLPGRSRRPAWSACDIPDHRHVPAPHNLIDDQENRGRCRDLPRAVVQTTGVGTGGQWGGGMGDDVGEVVFVPVVEITTGREIGWNTNVSELLRSRLSDIKAAISAGAESVASSLTNLPTAETWQVKEATPAPLGVSTLPGHYSSRVPCVI